MKTTAIPFTQSESKFHALDVSLISGGHFVHDVYTAFVSPLLPELIRFLGISLAQAGVLSAAMQLPSLLNPLIGYLDDQRSLRIMMILAPGITATLLSSIGLAPNYASLILLLFVAGLSIASFHAIAPARLARLSGSKVGRGMSLFMSGGELGRTLGPLLAVWAVSTWTLKGILPLAIFGWVSSLILWFQFNEMGKIRAELTSRSKKLPPGSLKFFVPVTLFILFRGLMISSLGTYLPTLMTTEGANLWSAGTALAVYQISGFFGALVGGTASDKFGRRVVLAITMGSSSLFLILFLSAQNWLILIAIGFMNLTTQPIMLALIQDSFPNNRSMANGIYMGLAFIAFSITSVVVGALGDWIGLKTAFFWSGILSLPALPTLFFIRPPQRENQNLNAI